MADEAVSVPGEDVVRVVVISDEETDLKALAEVEGLVPIDDPEVAVLFDPATAALVGGAAILVGKFALKLWNMWRGGVEIRLGNPPQIKRNRQVPVDYVFVFTATGDKVEIKEAKELEDSLERLFTTLVKLPIDASTEVIKAVIEAAKGGDDKTGGGAAGGTTPAPA